MTLDEMCQMAARYSDRYDEFEKTDGVYEDDALHYYNVFKDAINEAYFDVARTRLEPDTYTTAVVVNGKIDLLNIFPLPYSVKRLLNQERTASIPFDFESKFVLDVSDDRPGDNLTLYYSYLPERLENLLDEPVFPESVVDPMIYVTLAVARMWQSEKKLTLYQSWMQDYYSKLRNVRPTMKGGNLRRIPRGIFR